jgi:archaellum component FlaC
LSISQKANADLILSILNSVKNYDEALYLQISNDVHSRIQRLNSSSVTTQEEQNAVNNQLGEVKQLIHSSLSSKLNSLKSEVSSLERSSSESEETAKNMLKYGAILLAVGIFAEVIASLIAIVIFIVVIIGGLAASGGGG